MVSWRALLGGERPASDVPMTMKCLFDQQHDITLVRIQGPVDIDEVIRSIDASFEEQVTRHVIWDVRQADISQLGLADLRLLSKNTEKWDTSRTDPTGIAVVKAGAGYALARLYAAVNNASHRPVAYHICLSLEQALAWLDIHQMPDDWTETS